MADVEYCSPEDVFRYAVPRGALAFPAREIASVDVGADTLELVGHGFSLDDAIEFRALPGGTIAAPLTAAAVFFAKPVPDSDSLFQVAATRGGAAIDLTTTGERFGVVAQIRETIRAHIRAASQRLHKFLPAHTTPIQPEPGGTYPDTVRQMTAVWAAHATCIVLGQRNELIAQEAQSLFDEARLLLAGVPTRDTGITTVANAAVARSAVDSKASWESRRGSIP